MSLKALWSYGREAVDLDLQDCTWRLYVPPKRRYLPTSPQGEATHKSNVKWFSGNLTVGSFAKTVDTFQFSLRSD
jgi:hypothetical protein